MHPDKRADRLKTALLCLISTALLFFGFFSNSWKVADTRRFTVFQRDDESMILGRLVKSRQDGAFSAGGLIGYGGIGETTPTYDNQTFEYQYRAYLNNLRLGPYDPYLSEIGAHALLFRLLDISMPFRPEIKLSVLYMLTSMLTAVTLTLIVLWFAREFGMSAGLTVAASMILSQWLVLFGRNLFYSIWVLYLPMVVFMYLVPVDTRTRLDTTKLGALVFLSVMLALLVRAFQYITTTLIMMMVPFVYFSVRDSWTIRRILKATLTTVTAAGLAGVCSVAILCVQIASVKGDARAGVHHIADRFYHRTVDDPTQQSLEPPSALQRAGVPFDTAHILRFYLFERYFELDSYLGPSTSLVRRLLGARYYHLVALFALASAALLTLTIRGASSNRRRKNIALVLATWFSILAPLSWLVIFKEHSYVHTHMNVIVWQMPFTFFGFAVCAVAFREVGARVRPHSTA